MVYALCILIVLNMECQMECKQAYICTYFDIFLTLQQYSGLVNKDTQTKRCINHLEYRTPLSNTITM